MTNEERAAVGAVAAEKPPMGEGPEYEGLGRHFWPVVETHGREMFQLVFAAGVGGHCAQLLMSGLRGQVNALNAVSTFVEQFNVLASMHIRAKGWTQEELDACDVAIRRAVDTKIIVPRDERRIILDS